MPHRGVVSIRPPKAAAHEHGRKLKPDEVQDIRQRYFEALKEGIVVAQDDLTGKISQAGISQILTVQAYPEGVLALILAPQKMTGRTEASTKRKMAT